MIKSHPLFKVCKCGFVELMNRVTEHVAEFDVHSAVGEMESDVEMAGNSSSLFSWRESF